MKAAVAALLAAALLGCAPHAASSSAEGPDAASRRAALDHARAQAHTLVKAEAFDQAQAAFEAALASHPEARDLIRKCQPNLALKPSGGRRLRMSKARITKASRDEARRGRAI